MFSAANQQSAPGRGNPSPSGSYANNDFQTMQPVNAAAAPAAPGKSQAQATSPDEYRILLPRFPPGSLCINSVFLHADMSGRPYRAIDFRDGLKDAIELREVLSLGQFQMSHVWMVTLVSSEAAEKLKAAKELTVKGKKCMVIDPNSKDVKLKLLWLPSYLEDKKIAEALSPFGTVRSVSREKWRVPGMENMETLNREVCLTLHDMTTSEDIPHLLRVAGIQSLLVMSGRPPLCLRCKKVGHIRRQCRTPKCARCNRFGHESDECYSSYAALLRGSGTEPDANQEFMDISEVVDATGEVLPTQAGSAEAGPPISDKNEDPAVKEVSETPQAGSKTENEGKDLQESKDQNTPLQQELTQQPADLAEKLTTSEGNDDLPDSMDVTKNSSKDTNDTKRKQDAPPDTTTASKRKPTLHPSC
ncbi:hypothetical protein ISCGN_005801 [Ixodes scapularis]